MKNAKTAYTALEFERHKEGTLLDGRCPGLRLEATAKKRSWIYRYRLHGGRLRQIKLGEFNHLTPLAKAREKWAEQKKIRDSAVVVRDATFEPLDQLLQGWRRA